MPSADRCRPSKGSTPIYLWRAPLSRRHDELRAALQWNPGSVEAHNNRGIALASIGRTAEEVNEFKQAIAIDAGFDDARRNLAMATRTR